MVKNLNVRENTRTSIEREGGKGFHLQLLKRLGFTIPVTYSPEDVDNLPEDGEYIVRSSAAMEDSATKTAAGRFESRRGVHKRDIPAVMAEINAGYELGSVVVQPDLTSQMIRSGVIYTNLNGELVISLGGGDKVHEIVEGHRADTEITTSERRRMKGHPLPPFVVSNLEAAALDAERCLGIPLDIEFAETSTGIILLQARPLPNPTAATLKEHEIRRIRGVIGRLRNEGIDELVLGVGNYREINGDDAATKLSTSTFNYIFSGDGQNVLGAIQLGRNDLGYDLGFEIFPWVIMVAGKVYYNFCGDALQFRPHGISKEDLVHVVNGSYLPQVRDDPDLLNYPELHLYVQFPEQAATVGLDPVPYRALAERNRKAIAEITIPLEAPRRVNVTQYDSVEECLKEILLVVDRVREGSAKDYVKAARLAFFALEDLRMELEDLKASAPEEFNILSRVFEKSTPADLRDALAYNGSIHSFETPRTEEFSYLGSFELSLERGFAPERHYKDGKEIPVARIRSIVENTRRVLENREKVKFFLFRDYDVVRQLYEQLGILTGVGSEIYKLDYSDLMFVSTEPALALYRIDFESKIRDKELFPDPIFENDLRNREVRNSRTVPKLIFGSLPLEGLDVIVGREGYVVNSVDQTVGIPEGTRVVFVPDNVRPGSHLFTVLSDYDLPVIAVPPPQLKEIGGRAINARLEEGILYLRPVS